jgi:hypothetical protein
MFTHYENNKLYSLANFLFLYLNVFVMFSLIYLLLDISKLGFLFNSTALNNPQELLQAKLMNAIHLSAAALFSEGYGSIIPLGWSKAVAFIEQTFGFLLPAFIMIRFIPSENNMRSRTKPSWLRLMVKSFFVTLGALFVSLGLEIFLVPNHIIDGGIVGISIIMSYLTGLKLELYLLLLNLPFLYLGYRKLGKRFVVTTLLGITVLSLGTLFLYNVPVPTNNPLLASVFGGVFLGIGVGIVIRYGGSLDGTEILGILLNRRTSFSVGKIVMFINLFVFSSAALIFGWEKALFSLAAYYIASNMIDVTLEKFN